LKYFIECKCKTPHLTKLRFPAGIPKKLHSRISCNRRKVIASVCFPGFGIKFLSRAAFQTTSVSRLSVDKRAADIAVPAAEKSCNQAYPLSENKLVDFVFALFIKQSLKFIYCYRVRHIIFLFSAAINVFPNTYYLSKA